MAVPAIRRVVVGVSGTLGNYAALHAAADLARRCGAELVAVHVSPSPGDVLPRAIAEAFGGAPDGVELHPVQAHGDAGDALVRIAAGDGDVLVVGSGRQRRLLRRGPVNRYCVANARCPVLTVPPPALARYAGSMT